MRFAPIFSLVVVSFALAAACTKSHTGATPEDTTGATSSASSTAAGGPSTATSSSGSGGSVPTCEGPPSASDSEQPWRSKVTACPGVACE